MQWCNIEQFWIFECIFFMWFITHEIYRSTLISKFLNMIKFLYIFYITVKWSQYWFFQISFHDVTKPLIWMRFKFYAVDKHNKRSFNRSFSRKMGAKIKRGSKTIPSNIWLIKPIQNLFTSCNIFVLISITR